MNAIIHRTYSGPPIQISLYDDKIMIWNVGELPEQLTIDDLKRKHASYPKNPRLAEIFFIGGFIEAWGRGTLKIINECINFGLPEPKIELLTGGICVTIYRNFYNRELLVNYNLSERQVEALLNWKKDKDITTKSYKDFFKITDRTALRDLSELVEKGLLVKSGANRNAKYQYKS